MLYENIYWADRDEKIDNEQLLNCLSTQYNLVYEKNGMEMYARR